MFRMAAFVEANQELLGHLLTIVIGLESLRRTEEARALLDCSRSLSHKQQKTLLLNCTASWFSPSLFFVIVYV